MASFFQRRDEGWKETVVLHKRAMTFDWPSVEEAHPNRVWMGNAGSPRRGKNAQPNRAWMGDGLGWGWMGLSAGSDDVESCKPRVWTQHSSPSVEWRAARLMRGSRPSSVDTVSLSGRSMVICSDRHRLGSDPQWPRSDYPLLRAIIDWCSVCRSSERQPTWKLPGERRPVGH